MDTDHITKPDSLLKLKRSRSKFGCFNCKKKKKKCDEIKPICTGCLNKNLICEYPIKIDASSTNFDLDEKITSIDCLKKYVGEKVLNLIENTFISTHNAITEYGDHTQDNNNFALSPSFDSLEEISARDLEFLDLILSDKPIVEPMYSNLINTVPKSLPIKLPAPLTHTELSYFEFYCKSILPNLSILPQEFNYYSKVYIPFAFKEKSVLYTLIGWGCKMKNNSNLNFQIKDLESERYFQMVKDLILINDQNLNKDKFLTNFVCYMLLVCMEISFGDTMNWSHYFTSCFKLINKMPGDFKYLKNCSIEGKLLAENFAYFDVLASQSNENGIYYPIDDYHDLFHQNNSNGMIQDPLQGCIRPIILLIGEIVSMLVEFNSLNTNLDLLESDKMNILNKVLERSENLDYRIKSTTPDISFLSNEIDVGNHIAFFEIYKLSTQIYLRQVIRKLPPIVPEIQILSYNLRKNMKNLINSSTLKNSLAFPMLLLGISSTNVEDRKEVLRMFKSLIQSCGYLSSYQKLLLVVEKIWELNNNGSIYIDWFKITKKMGWMLNLGR